MSDTVTVNVDFNTVEDGTNRDIKIESGDYIVYVSYTKKSGGEFIRNFEILSVRVIRKGESQGSGHGVIMPPNVTLKMKEFGKSLIRFFSWPPPKCTFTISGIQNYEGDKCLVTSELVIQDETNNKIYNFAAKNVETTYCQQNVQLTSGGRRRGKKTRKQTKKRKTRKTRKY